jgi:hypothetical protein
MADPNRRRTAPQHFQISLLDGVDECVALVHLSTDREQERDLQGCVHGGLKKQRTKIEKNKQSVSNAEWQKTSDLSKTGGKETKNENCRLLRPWRTAE